MQPNRLMERLRAGEVMLGLCNMYPAAGIIEGMGSGWDFVWIDGQHGQLGYGDIVGALRAAAVMGLETMIRVPGHEPSALAVYADTSPSAIMIPMVNDYAEADAVVRALRFPPRGERSYGGRRVVDLHGREYCREHDLAVVAQIETPTALDNVDAIADTDGVDVLFYGPDDMKLRMGLPINTPVAESDELMDAMRRIAVAAREAGKFAAGVMPSPDLAAAAVKMGYQMLIGGGDIAFLRVAAAERLAELRAAVGKAGDKNA